MSSFFDKISRKRGDALDENAPVHDFRNVKFFLVIRVKQIRAFAAF